MEELKSCPFCGGKAVLKYEFQYHNGKTYWFVACKSCGIETIRTYRNTEQAVRAWNRRVAEDKQKARLINANVLVEKFWKPECRTWTRRDFVAAVDYVPAVDAVEVVRCKDCRHRKHDRINDEYVCNHDRGALIVVEDDDYCSCGERDANE